MKKMLLQLIQRIGNRSEFDLYLDLFHKIPKIKFAVIKISGQSLERHLPVIADDIAYLNKLDIYPVVVHGAGSRLDRTLDDSPKVNGMRVTSDGDIAKVKQIFEQLNEELSAAINHRGGCAARCENVFSCERLPTYGWVGRIQQVHQDPIARMIDNNTTPIISPIAPHEDRYLNINADTAARELVQALQPKKLIMLTETGGILDNNREIIPFINVSFEEELEDVVSGGMLLKVQEISEFLKSGTDCSVVITSPQNLLKEIFTIKGSGTFIKYHQIEATTAIESLDRQRIKTLLEDAFGKQLDRHYFEDQILEIFYQRDYEGIAILKQINNIPYLDKFAVAKFRQGTGLGKSLWSKLTEKYPRLIWRAKPDNPLNTFYMKHCDGMVKNPRWYVYWRNLEPGTMLPNLDAVINKRETFIAPVECENTYAD